MNKKIKDIPNREKCIFKEGSHGSTLENLQVITEAHTKMNVFFAQAVTKESSNFSRS